MKRALALFEDVVGALALAAMVVLPLLEIALRRIFGVGIPGSGPIVQHLVLWVGLLGAAVAARDGADATWALPRRVARSARPVVLVEVVEQRPDGGTRGTAVAAVEVSLADRVRDVRSWRRCARRLATEPLVVHAAKTAAARDDQVDQWASVRERLDEIGHRSAPRRSSSN